ncbi:uncharacterized protein G2W53_040131 [Senna tora]|uniref:Uncharacterized protein n=1 Tax=Senna tora TaxID=362788 RepID=A0A834SNY1_9FABA|nr:uncharacterized protein G2W53_040131 [Senna tora]
MSPQYFRGKQHCERGEIKYAWPSRLLIQSSLRYFRRHYSSETISSPFATLLLLGRGKSPSSHPPLSH